MNLAQFNDFLKLVEHLDKSGFLWDQKRFVACVRHANELHALIGKLSSLIDQMRDQCKVPKSPKLTWKEREIVKEITIPGYLRPSGRRQDAREGLWTLPDEIRAFIDGESHQPPPTDAPRASCGPDT